MAAANGCLYRTKTIASKTCWPCRKSFFESSFYTTSTDCIATVSEWQDLPRNQGAACPIAPATENDAKVLADDWNCGRNRFAVSDNVTLNETPHIQVTADDAASESLSQW